MKLKVDPILVIILGTLALGLLLPVSGRPAEILDLVTRVGVFVLFFGYGARLSAAETRSGLKNWRLHLAILSTTFVVFPLLAVPVLAIPDAVLSAPIRVGLIFLCLVPSTVQSSITFTSLAGGNVAAAMVSATASNVLGVVITPLLAIVFIPTASGGSIGFEQVWGVVVQLLLPFVLGQLSRVVTAGFMARHKARLKFLDQAVIMLIVYGAFSELRVSGVWQQLALTELLLLVPLALALLALMFSYTWALGGWLGFPREDRIALMFCGTKKSLATGVPMASVLFPGATVGVLVIPLMLYHQAQLLASSVLATRLREAQD
ncbi:MULTISPECIES: bile acid:sodium symporter family protein [unclassified Tessaracoccus]|uniref:bile acid:sodium symporter family protein n=1 Tax=unclassified Tessaracoccus TaxID=2635419 RepID=UPI0015FF5F0B|nr:bile acid:sodium symporter [Tessaracoccus sp. MC1627]MBB1515800.1 bile acid:sodium symporter [Tessaracoccus sp. MC1679]